MARVTLQDIAEKCGVTKATVSLALRNSPRISRARREEIQELAKQMGYCADPALSAIARARWKPSGKYVGHRLALVQGDASEHPYGQSLRQTITSVARRLGYRVEIYQLEKKDDADKLVRQLYHRGIRGTILWNVGEPSVALAFDGHIPVVMTGLLHDSPTAHHVIPDHFNAVCLAFQKIRQLKLKRILIALNPSHHPWHDAYARAALMRSSSELNSLDYSIHIVDDYYVEHGKENGLILQDAVRQFRPDVVLASNIVAYYYLNPAFRIPGDFSFICLDLPPEFIGTLAGVYPQPEEVGRVCMDMLQMQIQRFALDLPVCRNTILVEARWFDGPTFPATQMQSCTENSRTTQS